MASANARIALQPLLSSQLNATAGVGVTGKQVRKGKAVDRGGIYTASTATEQQLRLPPSSKKKRKFIEDAGSGDEDEHADSNPQQSERDSPDQPAFLQEIYRKCIEQPGPRVGDFLQQPAAYVEEDFNKIFEEFRHKEVSLFEREIGLRVRPSGSKNARAGLFLHYPSNKTAKNNLRNGVTADFSNPCVRLPLRVGVGTGRLLVPRSILSQRGSNTPKAAEVQRRGSYASIFTCPPNMSRGIQRQHFRNIGNQSMGYVWQAG